MKRPLLIFTLILYCLVFSSTSSVYSAEFTIPAARRITWAGNVGVYHCTNNAYTTKVACVAGGSTWVAGIPTDWDNCETAACNTLYGGTVTSATISAALASAGDNTVVRIPAGTYTLTTEVGFTNSNTILRGAGVSSTILSLEMASNAFDTQYDGTSGSGIAIDAGSLASGTTDVTVADGSSFSAGNMLKVTQDNDFGTGTANYDSTFMWGRLGSANLIQSVHYVVSVAGNVLTIDPALPYTLTAALNPVVKKYTYGTNWAKQIGFEDMTLKPSGTPAMAATIFLYHVYNSWISNVEFYGYDDFAVQMGGAARVEIRKCYAHDNYDTVEDVPFYFNAYVTGALLENNVANASYGVGFNGLTGSVVAYNYFVYSGGSIQVPSIWHHGSINSTTGVHNAGNLFEGNITNGIQSDGYHASSSHNTVFRNNFHGLNSGTALNRKTIDLARFSQYYNIVGNVLGDATWNPTAYEMSASPANTNGYIFRLGYPHMNVNTYLEGDLPQGKAADWNSKTSYTTGQYVFYSGLNYKALQNSTNKQPDTETAYWDADPFGSDYYCDSVNLSGIDAAVKTTILRHKNYDYENAAVTLCNDAYNTEGCQSATNVLTGDTIPSSLYLTEKPSWFGSLTWPSIEPATPIVNMIPAQYYYTYGSWPTNETVLPNVTLGTGGSITLGTGGTITLSP